MHDNLELGSSEHPRAGKDVPAQQNGRRLSSEREAEIRQRVLEGAYHSLSVVDDVARRILQCGDV